ncbi:MAG: TetR/AcrR family transcriptional regulator [Dehalococcoidia bacterium]|jgi:AcrR family transcriptional regulator|nr:TetR/AcrR family transcriptional regulator [Dehalococcoidia bacterium]
MPAQRETTRERILEAAEDAFADQGYHQTLVDDIAGRTSLSKGGFYFHFPSKEDLFFAVIDRLADRLTRRAEEAAAACESPLAGADAALSEVLTRLGRRRRLAKVLLVQGYSMGSAFEQKRVETFGRFAAVIRDGLDRAVEAGEIAPTNTEVVARAWLGAVNEIVVNWVYRGTPTPAEALPVLRTVLVDGLERPDTGTDPERENTDG